MKSKIDAHVHLGDFKHTEDIIKELQICKQYALCMTNTPEQFERLYKTGLYHNKYIKVGLGFNPQEIINRRFNAFQFMKSYHSTNYIGEVGLDYSKDFILYKEQQKQVFEYICRMAGRDKKILSIHSRSAETDVLEILTKYNVNNFIMHWYTGNNTLVPDFLKLGAYFSINQSMMKTKRFCELFSIIPSERILVETDAPYTLQKEDMYIRSVDVIYNNLYEIGLSKESIFDNFKELLLRL